VPLCGLRYRAVAPDCGLEDKAAAGVYAPGCRVAGSSDSVARGGDIGVATMWGAAARHRPVRSDVPAQAMERYALMADVIAQTIGDRDWWGAVALLVCSAQSSGFAGNLAAMPLADSTQSGSQVSVLFPQI
jgi:hypothetical protein